MADKQTAALIDQFVAKLNANGFEPHPAREIPASLRTTASDVADDWYDWRIQPISNAPWIESLEQKLPTRLPSSFHYFVTHYRYANFEVGDISFFPNTGEDTYDELVIAMFQDVYMSPFLLKNGLIQFGRRAGGHYDPICFDLKPKAQNREFPIVQIDHEEILCNSRLRVVGRISHSLPKFVEDFLKS